MLFKKIVAIALLISCSLTPLAAGRRSPTKNTCSHQTIEKVLIKSSIYGGLELRGSRCRECGSVNTDKEAKSPRSSQRST